MTTSSAIVDPCGARFVEAEKKGKKDQYDAALRDFIDLIAYGNCTDSIKVDAVKESHSVLDKLVKQMENFHSEILRLRKEKRKSLNRYYEAEKRALAQQAKVKELQRRLDSIASKFAVVTKDPSIAAVADYDDFTVKGQSFGTLPSEARKERARYMERYLEALSSSSFAASEVIPSETGTKVLVLGNSQPDKTGTFLVKSSDGTTLKSGKIPEGIAAAAISKTGSRIAIATRQQIMIYEATAEKLNAPLIVESTREAAITAVTIAPDDNANTNPRVAAGFKDGYFIQWKLPKGNTANYEVFHQPLKAHSGAVVSIGYSSNYSALVTRDARQCEKSGKPASRSLKTPGIMQARH